MFVTYVRESWSCRESTYNKLLALVSDCFNFKVRGLDCYSKIEFGRRFLICLQSFEILVIKSLLGK